MSGFEFEPSSWIPFRDKEVLKRVRAIQREEIEQHPNPEFKIRVIPDSMMEWIWVSDMFARIREARQSGDRVTFILPNPAHTYKHLAHLINRCQLSCDHLHVFIMDEYADEDGRVAPESWPLSFMYAFKTFFYKELEPALRPPEEQIHGPTTENIRDYGRRIADIGGADACYSGPGWTGHLAFIEPDAPEFEGDLETWKGMSSRIVTLSPFTIAQNSLHGFFGMSGDLGAVPPRAATIGPAEVIGAQYRMDMNALTTDGTNVSWQRFICRLVSHGPVTPLVPTSILQTLPTDYYITETIAMNIEPFWDKAY